MAILGKETIDDVKLEEENGENGKMEKNQQKLIIE